MACMCGVKAATSFDELLSLVDQFRGEVRLPDELLEADEGQQVGADVEQRHETEEHEHEREVHVEAVRDERHDVHVAHHLQHIT